MTGRALDGKRVLVIGAETALGRAIAIALAEAGADVAPASLSPGRDAEYAVNSALNEVWAIGRKGIALALDASDEQELRLALERAEHELGGIDLAVAAGAGAGVAGLVRDVAGDGRTLPFDADAALEDALTAVTERLLG